MWYMYIVELCPRHLFVLCNNRDKIIISSFCMSSKFMLVKLKSVAFATGELQHDVNYYVKNRCGCGYFFNCSNWHEVHLKGDIYCYWSRHWLFVLPVFYLLRYYTKWKNTTSVLQNSRRSDRFIWNYAKMV